MELVLTLSGTLTLGVLLLIVGAPTGTSLTLVTGCGRSTGHLLGHAFTVDEVDDNPQRQTHHIVRRGERRADVRLHPGAHVEVRLPRDREGAETVEIDDGRRVHA